MQNTHPVKKIVSRASLNPTATSFTPGPTPTFQSPTVASQAKSRTSFEPLIPSRPPLIRRQSALQNNNLFNAFTKGGNAIVGSNSPVNTTSSTLSALRDGNSFNSLTNRRNAIEESKSPVDAAPSTPPAFQNNDHFDDFQRGGNAIVASKDPQNAISTQTSAPELIGNAELSQFTTSKSQYPPILTTALDALLPSEAPRPIPHGYESTSRSGFRALASEIEDDGDATLVELAFHKCWSGGTIFSDLNENPKLLDTWNPDCDETTSALHAKKRFVTDASEATIVKGKAQTLRLLDEKIDIIMKRPQPGDGKNSKIAELFQSNLNDIKNTVTQRESTMEQLAETVEIINQEIAVLHAQNVQEKIENSQRIRHLRDELEKIITQRKLTIRELDNIVHEKVMENAEFVIFLSNQKKVVKDSLARLQTECLMMNDIIKQQVLAIQRRDFSLSQVTSKNAKLLESIRDEITFTKQKLGIISQQEGDIVASQDAFTELWRKRDDFGKMARHQIKSLEQANSRLNSQIALEKDEVSRNKQQMHQLREELEVAHSLLALNDAQAVTEAGSEKEEKSNIKTEMERLRHELEDARSLITFNNSQAAIEKEERARANKVIEQLLQELEDVRSLIAFKDSQITYWEERMERLGQEIEDARSPIAFSESQAAHEKEEKFKADEKIRRLVQKLEEARSKISDLQFLVTAKTSINNNVQSTMENRLSHQAILSDSNPGQLRNELKEAWSHIDDLIQGRANPLDTMVLRNKDLEDREDELMKANKELNRQKLALSTQLILAKEKSVKDEAKIHELTRLLRGLEIDVRVGKSGRSDDVPVFLAYLRNEPRTQKEVEMALLAQKQLENPCEKCRQHDPRLIHEVARRQRVQKGMDWGVEKIIEAGREANAAEDEDEDEDEEEEGEESEDGEKDREAGSGEFVKVRPAKSCIRYDEVTGKILGVNMENFNMFLQ
jgi:hypothetical protein